MEAFGQIASAGVRPLFSLCMESLPRPAGHTFAAVLMLVLVLGLSGIARAQTIVPVGAETVVVPPLRPHHYHDSDSCRTALNAALGSLSEQLGNIPFPPPGEPGYHEWANAIGAQMDAINARRPHASPRCSG